MERNPLSTTAISVISAALIAVVLIAGSTLSLPAWAQSEELDAAYGRYEELKKNYEIKILLATRAPSAY